MFAMIKLLLKITSVSLIVSTPLYLAVIPEVSEPHRNISPNDHATDSPYPPDPELQSPGKNSNITLHVDLRMDRS